MQNVVFGSFKTFNFVLFFFYFLECKLHCFQFVRQIGLDENICLKEQGSKREGSNPWEADPQIELLGEIVQLLVF